jgi:hypothetical protein
MIRQHGFLVLSEPGEREPVHPPLAVAFVVGLLLVVGAVAWLVAQ